ncbi:MAG: DNA mismatch repair protein MutS [Candidatus Rokuibacteriota bacterium]|nr:MAG: DNA mismatch repair protein MutS [Candidatus Rokubacteria bacterium]
MMRQYQEQKRRFPDHLLLFRLGDFYELFADDAELGARLLSITLTSRQGVPMAGIPHHAAESYIARLVRAGRKIAISEQMELPGQGKKLLRRDVVRVITPGTITDTAYLPGAANNFLLVIGRMRDEVGVALVDVSTGEFWCGEERGEGPVLAAALLRRPAEILLPDTVRTTELAARLSATGATLTFCDAGTFAVRTAKAAVVEHFGESTVGTAGLHDMTIGLGAAAAALAYVRATQGDALGHLTRLARLTAAGVMTLDETAVATLELLEASDGDGRHSLFAILNDTVTPMGARLLRSWLLRPLTDPTAIAARQTAVGELVQDPSARSALRAAMRGVGDLERLTSRAALGAAHARDLVGLRHCLQPLGTIRGLAAAFTSPLLGQSIADLIPLDDLERTLADALTDEPPLVLHDGRLIRETWSAELAQLVEDAREARAWIASLEERERTRTGISSLRVRFNRVFGYGIEVSHGQVARVPAEYIRRQTLTGAERYVTTELKEYEAKVLGADERRKKLEYELFDGLRRAVAGRAPELVRTASALALLDVVAALAEVAHTHRHVRPTVDDSQALSIVDGRHPVLEVRGSSPITPNDVDLDDDRRIVILTGPNMAGKSVYLRQIGHLVILAQMGAWVPAREARIGVVDRVFTRVGAQDNVSRGQSTFLVEMVETATIMRHVTPRSLVLLDEVGRGTSTFDGLAIAWAVVEHLHGESRAKVLFATHFHELTRLADRLPAVKNFHVAVREWNDEIVFLHKVRPGSTDRSYGIQVARLAGLPPTVIRRAKELLVELEAEGQRRSDADDAVQLGLWEAADDPVLSEIAQLDVGHLTPLEALNRLAKLRERVLASRGPDASCG